MNLMMFRITGYFISSMIIMLIISIFSIIIGHKIKKLDMNQVPGKRLTLVIGFVGFINNYVKNNIGKHWRFLSPFVLTIGIYVFLANISGLFLLDAPTKYTAITGACALFAVMVTQLTGIVSQGWRHFKTLAKPNIVMLPLNILSDLTPLVSMTLRLFGNIASGAVLLTLIYRLTGFFAPIVVLLPHVIFDLGFGTLQAVVFVMLTVIFASGKVKEEDLLEFN